MNTKLIVRVSVLAGALLVAALPGYGSSQGTSALAASNRLDGVWIATVTPEAQPTFTDVTTFHGDGSVTVMENDGRLGIGVWEKVSGRRYIFTLWEYWKEGEAFFQAKISSTIELSKDGKEYSGPFTVQIFVVGNPDPVLSFSGTATGVRMHVK